MVTHGTTCHDKVVNQQFGQAHPMMIITSLVLQYLSVNYYSALPHYHFLAKVVKVQDVSISLSDGVTTISGGEVDVGEGKGRDFSWLSLGKISSDEKENSR